MPAEDHFNVLLNIFVHFESLGIETELCTFDVLDFFKEIKIIAVLSVSRWVKTD